MKKILIVLFSFYFLFAFNHLKNSDSEYLLEHANNPIDWYPWSKEAFNKAKKENKLIFVSIGYSTCHWCHVMLKESFNDKDVANILNKYYVSIKVDKEQSPEIDRYYQSIYKKIYKKSAGWPLNIIMLPNKKIIYMSTYIPKKDIFKKKGFLSLLPYFANLWEKNPKKLLQIAKNFEIKQTNTKGTNSLNKLKQEIIRNFDFTYGGFKGMHKFLEYNKFLLLYDIYLLTKEKKFLKMLDFTLTKIAISGTYDQVEGGFFRYSTFDDFSIPHFEKMLYSNALMIDIYSMVYKLNKNSLYKKVIIQTIDEFYKKYFDKKTKLFNAASSADSPKEGEYFTFSKKEIFNALKNIPNKKEILDYINFDEEGNFEENQNHLYLKSKNKPKNFDLFLSNLKKIRKTKKYPFIDNKKILSWNSMMVSSLFKASIIDKRYKKYALSLLDSIYKNFYQNGTFYHSFLNRKIKKANLEDFAYLFRALLDAYEYTQNSIYLSKISKILNEINKFKKNNIWYMSANFIATLDEKSYPSALSVLYDDLLRYATLKYDINLYNKITDELNKYNLTLEYAYLTHDILEKKYNIYLIKSKNVKIYSKILFPFILWKKNSDNFFQVCNIFACIKRSDDFKQIQKFFSKLKYK